LTKGRDKKSGGGSGKKTGEREGGGGEKNIMGRGDGRKGKI